MKTRNGFVSNSSSSSFIISKKKLTREQIWALKNHLVVATWIKTAVNKYKDNFDTKDALPAFDLYIEPIDEWEIEELDDCIKCTTFMDNFDLIWLAKLLGIKKNQIIHCDSDNGDDFEQ